MTPALSVCHCQPAFACMLWTALLALKVKLDALFLQMGRQPAQPCLRRRFGMICGCVLDKMDF